MRVPVPDRAGAVALALVVGLGSGGCALTPPAALDPSPASPSVVVESATPTPTVTPDAGRDLTRPGAATAMVAELMDAAGATRAVYVAVSESEAAITVVEDGQPQTWAWRGQQVQQVPSDIAYVAQRSFIPADFDFSDLGAMFRLAEAVSGSRRDQTLQIVDYAGGRVAMSVSTNPESRAVFFLADGSVLPTLDFSSEWGLRSGYEDVVGAVTVASGMGFGSSLGVYVDTTPGVDGAFERRQRTARNPVLVTGRTTNASPATFDPRQVDPAAVWGVLAGLKASGVFELDDAWTCVVDDRERTGTPRMYFTVNDLSFTTDLNGRVLD